MRWANPWAFAGLLLLALPILVHLLARRVAKLQRFPTLRFLGTARLLPRRSPNLTDPLLLLLRLCIVAAAVTALARPSFLATLRARGSQSLTRVLVLDTSASMRRSTASGESALAAARRAAQQLEREAASSITVETAEPASVLAGSVAWLSSKTARRELVLLSDFQLGTIDSTVLARIPEDIGIRLVRSAVPTSNTISDVITRGQGSETVARTTIADGKTSVEWQTRAFTEPYTPAVHILASAAERARIEPALQAALALGIAAEHDTTHYVAIVFPEYEGRLSLIRTARALSQPWMGDFFARLHHDSLLIGAALQTDALPLPASYETAYTVVARNSAGQPVVIAAAAGDKMLLLPLVEPGSLTSAALIFSAEQALSTAPPPDELQPSTLPLDVLQRWERPAGEPRVQPGNTPNDHSDGRWLWVLAALLLVIEGIVRRAPERVARVQPVKREKVPAGDRAA